MSNLILTENKKWKKIPFFDQKHGLTPFGKVRFLGLYSQKEFLFSSRTSLNLISSLMLAENKKMKKKIAFFDHEHGLTSLQKWDFGYFEKVFLVVQKSFFFSTKLLSIISTLISIKSK